MFTWLFALLTALCALLWTPAVSVAHACKCAEPEAPSAALASAQAVFQGEVAAIDDSGSERLVTLHVPKAWKGIESAEEVRVSTRKESAACGFPFELGQSYMIYAQKVEPTLPGVSLQVLRCGRTRPIAEAEADIHELGMGAIPVNVNAPNEVPPEEQKTAIERKRDQPAAGGCASCNIGQPQDSSTDLAALLSLISFGAMIALRRRPQQQR
jgi:hypothetical protein